MKLDKFKKLKSPYVLVLIGPPVSGKSFFTNKFKEKINPDVFVISRDQIVMDLHAEDNDDEFTYNDAYKSVNNKEVKRRLSSDMLEAAEGYDVIVDMTNMISKRRKDTLSYFGDEYTKIAVIFPILEWDEYMARNKKRESEEGKFIPESVLRSMISSYQPIKDDEGFDKVISI